MFCFSHHIGKREALTRKPFETYKHEPPINFPFLSAAAILKKKNGDRGF